MEIFIVRKEELFKQVHAALKGIHKPMVRIGLFDLGVFTSKGQISRRQGYETLEQLIADLGELHPFQADVLASRFLSNEPIRRVAARHNLSIDHINRTQREGIQKLAALILEREQALIAQVRDDLFAKVPPPTYRGLIGRTDLLAKLIGLLSKTSGPHVLAIVGLGGLGKTALVDASVRQLIEERSVDDVFWLRVEASDSREELLGRLGQALLPTPSPTFANIKELRAALKAKRYLVVLDNLADQIEDERWLQTLHWLADPARFVLTSRVLPSELSAVPAIKVGELKDNTAHELALTYARQIGLQLNVIDANLELLLARTGGNPLAIKLAIGLMRVLSPQTVTAALEGGTTAKTEALFEHIYAAVWASLDPKSKSLLAATLQASEHGAHLEHLRAVAGLSQRDGNDAAINLAQRSLLEFRAVDVDGRYGTHRLTRSFLAASSAAKPVHVSANLGYWIKALKGDLDFETEEANLYMAIRSGLELNQTIRKATDLLVDTSAARAYEWRPNRWTDLYKSALGLANSPAIRFTLNYQLGSLLLTLDDAAAARTAFEQACDLATGATQRGNRARTELALGYTLTQLKDYKAARPLLTRLIKNTPLELRIRAWACLAILNYAQEEYPAAYRRFIKAYEKLDDKDHHARARLRTYAGLARQADKQWRAALKQYRLASDLLADQPGFDRERAQIDLLRSSAFYALEDRSNAEAALQRAQAASASLAVGGHAMLESSFGRILVAGNKPLEAASFARSAAKLWSKLGKPEFSLKAADLLAPSATWDGSAGS